MNILLVGSGGREHALAWKIARSPMVTRLVAAPGNPGIGELAELREVAATDAEGLAALAKEIAADLVVVGPESALEAGLSDLLEEAGIPCFGPSKAAAQLETSKAFTKDFCKRHALPTGDYGVFEEADSAGAFLETLPAPYVVKADGLAAGKGVVVTRSLNEAKMAVSGMLGGRFGTAGARVVVEEFLDGQEVSLFVLCDGAYAVPFGSAQDHKRAYDGDEGPNTGGMGTYSPAPVFTEALLRQTMEELVLPAVAGMAAEGNPYKGVLFVGLMLTKQGPRLVEFNARFGDPECQSLMLRLVSDIVPYLHAAATGALSKLPEPAWLDLSAITVVLAAEGYPDAPKTGAVIAGAEVDFGSEAVVFHAGTKRDEQGRLVASGGRVLNVCALGIDLSEARDLAYAAVGAIDLPGGFYRSDIGWRALQQG